LLIDADRILTGPIAPQSFKAVTWQAREIGKRDGGIQYFEAFPALPIKTLEGPHELALCEKLSALVPEVQDHTRDSLGELMMYVKRKSQTPGRAANLLNCPSFRHPKSPW
jgi:hypothetical protein